MYPYQTNMYVTNMILYTNTVYNVYIYRYRYLLYILCCLQQRATNKTASDERLQRAPSASGREFVDGCIGFGGSFGSWLGDKSLGFNGIYIWLRREIIPK